MDLTITTPPHPLQFPISSRPQLINFHYASLSLLILFPQPEKYSLTFPPNQIIVLLPKFFYQIFSDHSSHHRVVCFLNPDSPTVILKNSPSLPQLFMYPTGGCPFSPNLFLNTEFSSSSSHYQSQSKHHNKKHYSSINRLIVLSFSEMFTFQLVIAPLFDLNQINIYLLRIYYVQGHMWGCRSAKAALDMTCPQGT